MSDENEKPKTRSKAKTSGVRSDWPFLKRQYLSTPAVSRNGVSEGAEVKAVQEQLGLDTSGSYDAKTREAVLDYQRENDLALSGVVDFETWEHLKGQK